MHKNQLRSGNGISFLNYSAKAFFHEDWAIHRHWMSYYYAIILSSFICKFLQWKIALKYALNPFSLVPNSTSVFNFPSRAFRETNKMWYFGAVAFKMHLSKICALLSIMSKAIGKWCRCNYLCHWGRAFITECMPFLAVLSIDRLETVQLLTLRSDAVCTL